MDDEEEEDGRACTSKQHQQFAMEGVRYIMHDIYKAEKISGDTAG